MSESKVPDVLSDKLNMNLPPEDIIRAHRQFFDASKYRPALVKFAAFKIKYDV